MIAQQTQSDASFFRLASMRVAFQWHSRQTATVWANNAIIYNYQSTVVLKEHLPKAITNVAVDPNIKSGSYLHKFCKILEDKIENKLAAKQQKPGEILCTLKPDTVYTSQSTNFSESIFPGSTTEVAPAGSNKAHQPEKCCRTHNRDTSAAMDMVQMAEHTSRWGRHPWRPIYQA